MFCCSVGHEVARRFKAPSEENKNKNENKSKRKVRLEFYWRSEQDIKLHFTAASGLTRVSILSLYSDTLLFIYYLLLLLL